MSVGITQPSSVLLGYARFQRSYLFDVILPDIGISYGGLVGFGLSQLVQAVKFGDYSIGSDAIRMRFGPYQAHFAGLFTVEKVTITFLKTMPDAVAAYFKAWKDLIITPTGLYQVKSKYQKTIKIRFVDQSGIAMGEYRLIGAFPVTFPSYDLSYATNDVTKIDIDFQVDRIEYEIF
jgi:hypothetical protein